MFLTTYAEAATQRPPRSNCLSLNIGGIISALCAKVSPMAQSSEIPLLMPAAARTVVDGLRRLWWIHLPIILAMTLVAWLVFNARLPDIEGTVHIYHLLYLLPAPYVALAILGLLTPSQPLPIAETRRVDRLIICLVTKGTNPEVVRRTYHNLLPLIGERVQLRVVTDRVLDIPHLLVPAEFQTRHARYKARAGILPPATAIRPARLGPAPGRGERA